MTPITEQAALAALCEQLRRVPYITVDTEFMRDSTYWPRLCLVQVAGSDETAAAIDPMAPGLDLEPLFALLANPKVLKVMHGARQDIEIFFHLSKRMPKPVFDTQVAAMVCGFGEQVAYETLVTRLTGKRIDKASRFADWARRPLSEPQLRYALDDVIHLRGVYEKLAKRLAESGRAEWVEEEDALLVDPETYRLDPETAWLRLKSRSEKPRFLAALKAVAAWREREAQRRDAPRNWVLKDETLLDIAGQAPASPADLARCRNVPRGFAESRQGRSLIEAIAAALAEPESTWPQPPPRRDLPPGLGPVVDLLKVLLKAKCEASGVAQKLVASTADLEAIAADDAADVPALHGWRHELFGTDALALKHGRLALAVSGRSVAILPTGRAAKGTGDRAPDRKAAAPT